jgi:tetratricopeptide (TPR) repeat protein/transglutaminase-like putative cysteine protease
LHIIRGTQVIDLLDHGQAFTVLRRENNLEYSALDGVLSAAIQPEGLQVGDTLNLAFTLKRSDPVMGGTSEKIVGGWPQAPISHIRLRALWPRSAAIRWRISDTLRGAQEKHVGASTEFALSMDNFEPLVQPVGAPSRYLSLRQIEFTGFKSWTEVSSRLAPMYSKAATLSNQSPLQAEISRIRAGTKGLAASAEAVLALVQDQVRYVYLGMNDGGLVPAAADLTWTRRFGDCKAKTVLLLALLHGLGIDAQPVAVNTVLGDGFDKRLPMIGVFNHVLVRANIGGESYWLDGTRSGDRRLKSLATPSYRWALPLVPQGSELVAIGYKPLPEPLVVKTVKIDATAGIDVPAKIHANVAFGGDIGLATKLRLENLGKDELQRALHEYWLGEHSSIQDDKVRAQYDETTGRELLSVDGSIKMDWSGDLYDTYVLSLGYDADFKREAGPNQDAPFLVAPRYNTISETMLLPNGGDGFAIGGVDIDRQVAGVEYHRHAVIENGVFSAESRERSVADEFPYPEAEAAQKALREMTSATLYVRAHERPTPSKPDVAEEAAQTSGAADAADSATQFDATAESIRLGGQMVEEHQYKFALENFGRALELSPKNDRALAMRGLTHVLMADEFAGRKDLDAASAINPRSAIVYLGRGMLAFQAKKYSEAISDFTTSIEIEPRIYFGYENRAKAYLLSGDDNKALPDISEAIRRRPHEVQMYESKADILLRQGKNEEASDVADLLIASNSRSSPPFDRWSASALVSAGHIYLLSGRKQKARDALDRSLKLRSSTQVSEWRADEGAWTRYAKCRLAQKKNCAN